jgi:oligopeptide/dipeptide ABC transporter ATP-binding protein
MAGAPRLEPLLRISDLRVEYPGERGSSAAVVDGACLEVARGEIVGIVGESGSGKTTLALSLLGLLPAAARTVAGSIRLHGQELVGLPERRFRRLRGAAISLIFQEPGIALNPVMRAGDQVAEVLRAHRAWGRGRCGDEAVRLLAEVGLPDPTRLARAYPHELSGGQRQRVTIAQAIACGPELLVADEPTSALDATTRAEVLALLLGLRDRLSLALLFVTHDLGTLAALADRVLVMYAGRIVEEGPKHRVCREPLHPYTRALLAAIPRPRATGEGRALPTIDGGPPDLSRRPPGCAFEPRCPDRMDVCRERVPLRIEPAPLRHVSCFKHGG